MNTNIYWVIEGQLARGRRPGYPHGHDIPVSQTDVDAWLHDVREFGIQSIICLLADDQLIYYSTLPSGLIEYYRQAGFTIVHVPAQDHTSPPLTATQLQLVLDAYLSLPKPALVHCSAGIDRTGLAVKHICSQVNRTA